MAGVMAIAGTYGWKTRAVEWLTRILSGSSRRSSGSMDRDRGMVGSGWG
jgi:hypothetical protein